MAFESGRIYRMNGFDGKTEQGGRLDVYDVATDTWSSFDFAADGIQGPGARSVSALVPVHRSDGTYLVTLFGESDPSSLGHMGAGKMLGDIWAFSIERNTWQKLSVGSEVVGSSPASRGWFDADAVFMSDCKGVVVVGGLGEENQRYADCWLLSI
jgi:hypothetical protein